MRTMTTREAPVILPPHLFTLPEAAWAANTGMTFVRNEVDKKVVTTKRDASHSRLLDHSDLYYFRAMSKYHGSIDVGLRKEIYTALCKAIHTTNQKRARVQLDLFVLYLGPIRLEIDSRIHNIMAARASVCSDSAIRDGEPCVKGTRIPVYTLQEIAHNGSPAKELAVEYDLTLHQVEMALLYAKLHPRKGRPARKLEMDSPGRIGDVRRVDIESLGEFPKS